MGRLSRNLCYVEIYRAAQNTRDDFKKTLLSLEGISRFCANLDETKGDMVQFAKGWN